MRGACDRAALARRRHPRAGSWEPDLSSATFLSRRASDKPPRPRLYPQLIGARGIWIRAWLERDKRVPAIHGFLNGSITMTPAQSPVCGWASISGVAAAMIITTIAFTQAQAQPLYRGPHYHGMYGHRSIAPATRDRRHFSHSGTRGRQGLGASPAHPEGAGNVSR
jgi:hypothetical protein